METLTSQEYIYAARAFRCIADKESKYPASPSEAEIYAKAVKTYRELAEKCERIAKQST